MKWTKGLLMIAVACLGMVPSAWAEKKPVSDRVAVVNGSVITMAEFNREFDHAQRRFSSMGRPLTEPQLTEVKKGIIENLVNRELLYQESQKKGAKVEESAINEQLAAMKKQFPNEGEFNNALTRMNLTEADLKSQIKRAMAIQQFIEKQFVQKTTISDKDTKSYYDSHPESFRQPELVRASHILIKVDPKAEKSQKSEARKTIEKIQKRLKKGEDFATVAKEVSQCPSSAKGGDLGFFGRGQMAKPFEDAAFALKQGELSDIIETEFGYHLIKVAEKKPETTLSYDEVKGRLEQYLKQEKVNREVSQYVETLKGKAKIERILPINP